MFFVRLVARFGKDGSSRRVNWIGEFLVDLAMSCLLPYVVGLELVRGIVLNSSCALFWSPRRWVEGENEISAAG